MKEQKFLLLLFSIDRGSDTKLTAGKGDTEKFWPFKPLLALMCKFLQEKIYTVLVSPRLSVCSYL